jgi:hypothetical protein
MQSEAYKLTGFTAVVSAAGFLLRWLQGLQILDTETGLAQAGKPISYIVAGLILLMALGFGALSIGLKKYHAPTEPEKALAGKTFLYTALGVVPSILIGVCGVIMMIRYWPAGQTVIWKLCGASAIAAAFGGIMVARGISRPENAGTRRVGIVLVILFGCLWLIAEYKSAAVDPVLWRYCVEILAICSALMAFYHVAGYFFGEPSPRQAVFFCYIGAFLCIMSAVDEHTMAESVCYAAVALQLLLWGYALILNLRRGDEPEEEPGDAEA